MSHLHKTNCGRSTERRIECSLMRSPDVHSEEDRSLTIVYTNSRRRVNNQEKITRSGRLQSARSEIAIDVTSGRTANTAMYVNLLNKPKSLFWIQK